MTRQVTDQLYIDLGYFTPENYFVYSANAQLTASSSGTLTATVGLVASANASITATATVSCDALRLRTQSADASLSASASFSSDAVKTVDVQSTQSADFALSGSAGRILEGQGSFTGAFSPTLTVEVIKNHTAIIDAIFTVTTIGVANRATAITTSTIAALDAQAAKTVDVVSNHASTATISTQASSTKSATATLTSTATVTCDAFNVQFASASLSVGSVLYSRVFKRYDVPWQIESTFGNPSIDTSIKKWGAGSLTSTGGTGYIRYYPSDDWPSNLVLEFWHYRSTTGTTGVQINLNRVSDSAIIWNLNTNSDRVNVSYASGSGSNVTSFNSGVSTLGTGWQHIVYVYDAAQAESAIFIDGVRKYFRQDPVMATRTGRKYFDVLIPANTYKIDELRILQVVPNSVGFDQRSTTCTVPNGSYRNTATTRFLAHYDTDFAADFTELELGQASLSSTATFTVTGQKSASTNANLTGQSTVSVIGSLLNVAQASITSTASLSAIIGTSESGQAVITASADLTAIASKTTDINSSQNAEANTSTTIIRQRNFTVSLTGAFTPTLTVDVLRNHTAILDAISTLTAQISAVQTASASITATSTVSANISIIRSTSSALSAQATLTAQGLKLPSSGAVLSSAATVSAVIGLRQRAIANITCVASLTADVARTRGLASTQFSVSSLQLTSANVYRNLGDQTVTATASVSASVTNRIGFVVALTSTASVTAVVVKTTSITSTQQVQFTQSASAAKTVNPTTAFSSIATQLTGIGYNATGTVLLESTASLTAIIGSIKQYVGNSISGVKAESSTKRYAKLASGASLYNESGITMAIWARRDDLNPSTSQFWSTDLSSFSLVRFGFVNQTTARFSVGGSGFVENWNWNNSVPYDNLWHHYIVRIKRTGVGLTNGFDEIELWVDGEYKGLRTNSQGFNIYNWSVFGPINLGRGPKHPSEASGPYYFDGDLAQIWIGDINNFVLSSLWNNGPIDLGATGTNDGFLPTPSIYSSIDTPYTNITFWEDNDSVSALGADQPLDLPDMTVKAALSAGILGVFLYGANLTATTAMTCSAVKTTDAVSTQSAQATILIDAVKSTGIISNQSAAFTLDADVNLGPAGGSALADHQATLECQAGYLRSQSSTQLAQATMTTEAMVIPPVSGDALLTVFASQTTTAGYLISAQSSKSAVTTMTTEGTVIDPVRASGTLQVDTALTCEITRVRPGISLEMSTGTLTCAATVIPPIRTGVNLSVEFTMSVAVSGVFDTITLTASMGTMSIVPVKTVRPTGQITGQFTQQTIPGTRIGIVAVLSAQGFILTAGDVINIDPYLTLMIRPESRQITVEAETRTIRILPESRTLTIEGYTT